MYRTNKRWWSRQKCDSIINVENKKCVGKKNAEIVVNEESDDEDKRLSCRGKKVLTSLF